MSKNWYPVINYNTCTTCGKCVEYCCNHVYQLENEKVMVANPDNCCEGEKCCESICPTESITHFGDDGSIKEVKCSCEGGCC
jgi:NAD-dependent dihydropyrimidine dehydrogenase PreA subunit